MSAARSRCRVCVCPADDDRQVQQRASTRYLVCKSLPTWCLNVTAHLKYLEICRPVSVAHNLERGIVCLGAAKEV